jgi:structural maintenance of chromosome 1
VRFGDDNAQRFDEEIKTRENALGKIGDKIEKLQAEIQGCEDQLRSFEPQERVLGQKYANLKSKKEFLEADLRKTQREIQTCDVKIGNAQECLEKKVAEVESIALQQSEIDKSIFRDFCQRHGVQNIKEFELTRLQTFEERYAHRLKLQSRLSQLENLITNEDRSDLPASVEKLESDLEKYREELQKVVESLSSSESEYTALLTALESEKKAKEVLMAEDESNIIELKRKRRELREKEQDQEQTTDAMTAAARESETAMQSVSSILQQCRLTNIDLPRLRGRAVELENTPGSFTQECIDRSEIDEIDFSSLSPASKAELSVRGFEEAVKRWDDQIAELKAAISQIRPDLKSEARIQEVDKDLEALKGEQEALRAAAIDAKRKFAEAKQCRFDAFMKLFEAIDASIDKVYKKLTRMRRLGNRAGTAYLALENVEDPYLGGIKYTAMPPHKRFRDLEQLSGGEQALASLALIIALQKYLGAPFILMDEPDASLDKLNIRCAALALREIADESQIVVVSLRDRFFEAVGALIGISRNAISSGVMSYNLSNIGAENLRGEGNDD